MLSCAVRSFPPWQTLVCTQTIVCLLFNRQLSVRPPAHPRGGLMGRGGEGGGWMSARMVCASGWLCCSHELGLGRSRGFRRPCTRVPPHSFRCVQRTVAARFSGSFLSAYPATRGYLCWDRGGERSRVLVWCVPMAGCVTPMSSEGGWVPGVPESAPAEKTPPPLPRQAGLCRSLAAHPPTHGGARMALS